MNKILLIIQREYLSRVKKKSFIVMTFLTPLIFAGFYALVIYFSIQGVAGTFNKIAVVNDNKILTEKLVSNKNNGYTYVSKSLAAMKADLKKTDFDYILYIPEFELDKPHGIQLLGTKQAGINLNNKITDEIENLIRTQKLKENGISQQDLDKLKSSVDIDTKKILDGPVAEIREQYRNNTYWVEYQGSYNTDLAADLFDVVQREEVKGKTILKVLLKEGRTANQLLAALLPVVAIHRLDEVIPTMNDIFIDQVKQKN